MANDLATLNALLDTALRDTSDVTWSSAEKDSYILDAVQACPPRPLRHDDVPVNLISGTYHYSLPTSVLSISRLDIVDADGVERGPIAGGLWSIDGDLLTGESEVHISPHVVDRYGTGAKAYAIGYGQYDLSTNLVPTEFLPFVIAHARAAAYNAMAADRARFKQWANDEQTLNISVNELLGLLNDAQLERDRERARIRQWRKPMPAMRSA